VFVCIPPEKAVPKITYTVSGRTLNSTHSLTKIQFASLLKQTQLWEQEIFTAHSQLLIHQATFATITQQDII